MPNSNTLYLDLDKTGQATNNLVELEAHSLPNTINKLIIPKYGAFFSESIQVYWVNGLGQNVLLEKGIDYYPTEMLHKVTAALGKEISTVILLIEPGNKQNFVITYQALGGSQQINRDNLFNVLYQIENPSVQIDYKDIKNKPKAFIPGPHLHDSLDLYGLEYIRDAINRLDSAILIGNQSLNQAIVDSVPGKVSEFLNYDLDKTHVRVDATMALVKSAEDTLKTVYDNTLKIAEMMEKLITDKEVFNTAVMDFRADSYNDKVANVANLLCKKRFPIDGLVVNVPTLIEGNVIYLTSDNYNQSTGVWQDQTPANGSWIANVSERPDYGLSSSNPTINSLKFTNGKFLTRNTGGNLTLTKNRTIFTVTAPIANTDHVQLNLFTDNSKKLTIDTGNSDFYKYSKLDDSTTYYNGKISNAIGAGALVNVATIGERKEDCYVLSSAPFKKGIAPTGVASSGLDLNGINSTISTIGSPVGEQSAEVMMILMYDRLLSRAEIHAILTYIRLKYNTSVSFIENGDFNSWDENYGSDLINAINFTDRCCASVTDRNITLWDSANTYSQPGITNPLNIKIDDNPYLLVLSNDSTKAFWRQTVELDVYCRHELRFSIVYGQVNKPLIRMRINGLGVSFIVDLPANQSIVRDYVIPFTPTNGLNRIELFNLNESLIGNCFGIGAISVVRKIYAD